MSTTQFSMLPWFIREEIIGYVGTINIDYCLIAKEWLRYTIRRHSHCTAIPRKFQRPYSTFLTKSVTSLKFDNLEDTDWDKVKDFRNVISIVVNFNHWDKPNVARFQEYILNTSHITCLSFGYKYMDSSKDIEYILKAHRTHLKELKVFTRDYAQYHSITELVFPNLTSFKFSCHDSFCFKKMVANMPSLRKLSITINQALKEVVIDELKTVEEFTIGIVYRRSKGLSVLDLAKLPALKQLSVRGNLKYTNIKRSHSIDSLTIFSYDQNLGKNLGSVYSHLKKLTISIGNRIECKKVAALLPLCTRLSYLCYHMQLSYFDQDYRTAFPRGVFPATTFKMSGRFEFESGLLVWLSECFKLQKLEFEVSKSVSCWKPDKVSFDALRHIIVRAPSDSLLICYRVHFKPDSYPQVDLFEFINTGKKLGMETKIMDSCSEARHRHPGEFITSDYDYDSSQYDEYGYSDFECDSDQYGEYMSSEFGFGSCYGIHFKSDSDYDSSQYSEYVITDAEYDSSQW